MATDYSTLLAEYPEVISMEQLYQICHISKRKARWLLEHGVIPCQDSKKKTRRFKIRTIDVVQYLRAVKKNPGKMATPVGLFTNNPHTSENISQIREMPLQQFRKCLQMMWADAPDALEIEDVERLTGYRRQTIGRWLCREKLKCTRYPSGIKIAKKDLIVFIASHTVETPYTLPNKMRAIVDGVLEHTNN